MSSFRAFGSWPISGWVGSVAEGEAVEAGEEVGGADAAAEVELAADVGRRSSLVVVRGVATARCEQQDHHGDR